MNRLDLDVAEPTAGIPIIPQGKHSRAFSDPEISRLLRWLESGAVSRRIGDVLQRTLYTGARSGEVCSMRSRDVDLDAKTWTHAGENRRCPCDELFCAPPSRSCAIALARSTFFRCVVTRSIRRR